MNESKVNMEHFNYVGSGPYCYSNSFAMVLGKNAPSTAVIEFAIGGPFGMQMINVPGKRLFFFDPYGWDPAKGFDNALEDMGWRCTEIVGTDETDALAKLHAAVEKGPVFVGPVEMGHLRHQPNAHGPMGADHYVVVLQIDQDYVVMHDPAGYPYATLPVDKFMAAWKTDTLGYGKSYSMRTNFEPVQRFSEEEIILRCIPSALGYLKMSSGEDMPPGSTGNAEAAESLAKAIETDFNNELRGTLIFFAVQVGARRASDAASCLSRIGYNHSSAVMGDIAQIIGSLQYPLVVKKTDVAASILRKLGPLYNALTAALEDDARADGTQHS